MSDHVFKVPDVHCQITGTDDYVQGAGQDKCIMCSYFLCCQAKYNEQELIEAKELLAESKRYEDEAKQLKDKANALFGKVIQDNGLIKYQFDNLMVMNVTVHESVTYPKAKLLKTFTVEQLAPASEVKPEYSYLRIDDLLKERKSKND
jgi:aspartyl/asparaginyl beta-hydroxylase (cupin superfamily)